MSGFKWGKNDYLLSGTQAILLTNTQELSNRWQFVYWARPGHGIVQASVRNGRELFPGNVVVVTVTRAEDDELYAHLRVEEDP